MLERVIYLAKLCIQNLDVMKRKVPPQVFGYQVLPHQPCPLKGSGVGVEVEEEEEAFLNWPFVHPRVASAELVMN